MRWLLILAALTASAQTKVQYPSQISLGPMYVSPTVAGLPTVCIADTPFWIVGNSLYQNQGTVPACNWVQIAFLQVNGTTNTVTKFTAPTTIGNSGITDTGTLVSTSEAVQFTGPTTTVQVFSTTGGLPSTGCTAGQLAIVLGASISGQIYETQTGPTCAWSQQGGAGGGATIAVTTNLISGDGAGNGVSSGIAAANVIVSTGSYSNPGFIAALAGTKITTCCVPVASGGSGTATPAIVAGTGITVSGSWPNQTVNATGGGGGTIPNTTNILQGDGSGNAADSGIGAANVIVSSGSYSDPAWITALSASILNTGTVACARLPALTGDTTTTAGSCATVTAKINGTAFPASTNVIGSNSSSQPVAATGHNLSVPRECTDTSGSATAQSCTTTPTFTLTSKDCITYIPGTTNTGDLTATINGSSAIHFRKWQSTVILAAGDMQSGIPVVACYDGTYLNVGGSIGNAPTGGTVTSVGQTVPTWLTVTGSPVTSTGTLAVTAATGQTSHQVIGTCGSATTFGPCQLTAHDQALPLACVGGVSDTGTAMTCSTTPTFAPAAGDAILFQPHLQNSSTSLTLNVNGAGAKSVMKGAGAVGVVSGDLLSLTWAYLVFDGTNWQIDSQTGNLGTVYSVGLTAPAWLTVSGSPVTTLGTLAVTAATGQTAHQVIGTCGTATSFGPCALVAGDLPAITSGSAVQKGNGSGGLTTAAAADVVSLFSTCSGVQYLGADGACHSPGVGTVTSVAMTVPSIMSVGGSPITGSGTLAVTLATETANTVFSGPSSGSAATPTFRALVTADLPTGVTQTIASGTAALGTSAISSGACASAVTVTATGVATTDNAMVMFNADPTSTTGYGVNTSGTLTIYLYLTSGNFNVKVCNSTGSSITPGAATLNWRVVR